MEERVKRLEQSIVEVIQLAPAPMQEVVRGLQALRGIAHISAVTIAVELGNITSRFESAPDLMGYSGAFPSEDSTGKCIRRGGITQSGNAHLRRIVVEYECPRQASIAQQRLLRPTSMMMVAITFIQTPRRRTGKKSTPCSLVLAVGKSETACTQHCK
jgi:transposase